MSIIKDLENYRTRHPDESAVVDQFLAFIASQSDPMDRHLRAGHLTACVWIRSLDGQQVVLVDHKKLGKWVQLGGHIEAGESPIAAATREAREESGLTSLQLVSSDIFDLAIHQFPAIGDFPAHRHFDIRYLFEADGAEAPVNSPESHAVHWIEVDQVPTYSQEESVRRLARKGRL